MNGSALYISILNELQDLHIKKAQDYGAKHDALANLKASEAFGIPAWVGALIRANDKMVRLQAAARGQNLVNESVEDSMMDLASYAILSLVLYRCQQMADEILGVTRENAT